MRKHQRPAPLPSRSGGQARASTLLVLLFAAAVLLVVAALPWLLSPQYHFACRREGADTTTARVNCDLERRLWWVIPWERQHLDGLSAAGLHSVRQPRDGNRGGENEQHWLTLSSAPQQRLLLLLPNLAIERRDLGLIYLRCGEPRRALEFLEAYVETCPDEERTELTGFVKAARRLAAELN